jgi:hypothetical protein
VKRLLLALVFCSSCAGCPVTPTPSPDAAAHYSCVTVCQRGLEMGCKWADPTPGGAECYTVCQNSLEFGLRWDLQCRSMADSCAAIDACN